MPSLRRKRALIGFFLHQMAATALMAEPNVLAVPAGTFTMGTDAPRQGPPIEIRMPAFAITATEVTVRDFRTFVEASGYSPATGCFDWLQGRFGDDANGRWDDPISAPGEDHPVVCIGWADAKAYADWLSAGTGSIWRLPTEAEWEYAAKGGDSASQPLSPDTACQFANLHDTAAAAASGPALAPLPCSDGYAKTAPVGGRKPNGFGLFDTLGNVSEWTASCWRDAYDAVEQDCARRVVRGGAWKDDRVQATTTSRVGLFKDFRSRYFGFRLVREH